MKLLVVLMVLAFTPLAHRMTEKNNTASFYDFTLKNIKGEVIHFSQFKGKKVLLVNVASQCGYTPQYADLQKLYETHQERLVILGFPANNFGGQEPGSHEEIASFCETQYGITFPIFEKISVRGVDKHPLYRWLSDTHLNGWNDQEPTWNFCKYLVDEKGKLVQFFPSQVSPTSETLLSYIR